MIVRIFRVRVLAGKQKEWKQKVEEHSIPWLRQQEGLISFYPGMPMGDVSREFSMTSIWESVDSIRRAVGEDWEEAILLADEADLVESVEMHHYETFGS